MTARTLLDFESQICYTLCVTANTPLDRMGLGGDVIFIDTENSFRAERIFQIAEHKGISEPDEILRNVLYTSAKYITQAIWK